MFWSLLITPVSVLVGFNCLIFLFIMDHIALLWFIPNNYWLDAKQCEFYFVRNCTFLFSSAQVSHSVMSNSLWPHGLHHDRLSCPSPTPGAYSNSCHRVGDAIQPILPLSFPSPLAFNFSQNQGLFKWVSSSHQVAKVSGSIRKQGWGLWWNWVSDSHTALLLPFSHFLHMKEMLS